MADKRKYRFVEKKDSKGGKTSLLFAVISALCFVVCVAISCLKDGNAGPFVGAIAIGAMLLAAYGFQVGMKSFSEKDVSPSYSVVGAILSGIVLIGYLTLFLTGAAK